MEFLSSHNAYNDTIDSLKNEFKNDTSNTVIICGGHDFANKGITFNDLKHKYKNKKIIIFNQEPLFAEQRQFVTPAYFKLLKDADEVWDYDEQNISLIYSYRPDIKLHILKPYKIWPSVYNYKDIDILFYGSLNKHRTDLLDILKKKYNVKILTDCYDLDQYILRSKILLNIHYYYECALQEQARMIRWIGAPCRIISEQSINNYLKVEEYTYEELQNI